MQTTMPAAFTIVTGSTWEGEPRPRVLPAGHAVALRGKFGKRFDVRGPHAWACPECGDVVFIERGDQVIITTQRHYWDEHGYTPALLP